nr:PREDICTED: uncharacterized protein LOC106704625 [Latimeria chalumnae]|eukprot:XP_014347557.1 PREDICTED: uncharacterized protein LOC106704625 [Latimeria chalumnae]
MCLACSSLCEQVKLFVRSIKSLRVNPVIKWTLNWRFNYTTSPLSSSSEVTMGRVIRLETAPDGPACAGSRDSVILLEARGLEDDPKVLGSDTGVSAGSGVGAVGSETGSSEGSSGAGERDLDAAPGVGGTGGAHDPDSKEANRAKMSRRRGPNVASSLRGEWLWLFLRSDCVGPDTTRVFDDLRRGLGSRVSEQTSSSDSESRNTGAFADPAEASASGVLLCQGSEAALDIGAEALDAGAKCFENDFLEAFEATLPQRVDSCPEAGRVSPCVGLDGFDSVTL